MSDQARLDELEMRVAFQEETLQQLNTALGDQQLQISRLEDTCRALVERLRSLQGSLQSSLDELTEEGGAPVERPPHY